MRRKKVSSDAFGESSMVPFDAVSWHKSPIRSLSTWKPQCTVAGGLPPNEK